MLHNVVNCLADLLLLIYTFRNRVSCVRINLLCQIYQQIKISIFQVTLFDVFIFFHIFLQVFLRRLIFFSHERRKLSFFNNSKFIIFRRSMSDLNQQKLWLELSGILSSTNKRWISVSLSLLKHKYFYFTRTCILRLELESTRRLDLSRACP